MTPDEYVKDRLDIQIRWYSTKAGANKRWYLCCSCAAMVSAATVPVISMFSEVMWARLTVAVCGTIAAVTTGAVALFKLRDNWADYRSTAEELKHEKYFFMTRSGPYQADDAFAVLVERVEALVSQEHSSWQGRYRTNDGAEAS